MSETLPSLGILMTIGTERTAAIVLAAELKLLERSWAEF